MYNMADKNGMTDVSPNKVTRSMIGMYATVKFHNGKIVCGTIDEIVQTRHQYGPTSYPIIKTASGEKVDAELRDDDDGVKSITVQSQYGTAPSLCSISGGKKSRRKKRKSLKKRKSFRKRR